jgi:lysophospholipase L1-like esterase
MDQTAFTVTENWIGAWSTSLTAFNETGISYDGFKNTTLRQIVHPLINGSKARIKLSNLFGIKSVTFDSVHIALQDVGAAILPGTDRKVTFNYGQSVVTVLPGAEFLSDPVAMPIVAGRNLTVSLYLADASGPASWHRLAIQTTYISNPGDHTADVQAGGYARIETSWFWLAGLEVVADEAVQGTLVTFGDSITDGDGAMIDANHRWPDYLAERIQRESPQYQLSVLNQGIGGNRLLSVDASCPGRGICALDRLEHDVLQQKNLKAVILLEGINDIGNGCHDAEKIITGMREIIDRVHAKGARVYGGTLTPCAVFTKAPEFYTPDGERTRQKVNGWIRTSRAFDGVIDFDQAIRDPKNPLRMFPAYDCGDHLHPNDAGYEAMANVVDLGILKGELP